MKYISIIILILILASTATALTASLGTARMILYTSVYPGDVTPVESFIKVSNANQIPVNITIKPLGDIENITTFLDTETLMQPNESKKIRFRVDLTQPGNYEGQIQIGFFSADPSEHGAPVGLASTIIIVANQSDTHTGSPVAIVPTPKTTGNFVVGIVITAIIIAVGLLAFFLMKRGSK